MDDLGWFNREAAERSVGKRLTDEEWSDFRARGAWTITSSDGRRTDTYGLIRLVNGEADSTTLRHEMLHAARSLGLISRTEWRALVDQYAPKSTSEGDAEERIAQAFEAWRGPNGLWQRLTTAINRVLSRLGIVDPSADTAFARLRDGSVWSREGVPETREGASRRMAGDVRYSGGGPESGETPTPAGIGESKLDVDLPTARIPTASNTESDDSVPPRSAFEQGGNVVLENGSRIRFAPQDAEALASTGQIALPSNSNRPKRTFPLTKAVRIETEDGRTVWRRQSTSGSEVRAAEQTPVAIEGPASVAGPSADTSPKPNRVSEHTPPPTSVFEKGGAIVLENGSRVPFSPSDAETITNLGTIKLPDKEGRLERTFLISGAVRIENDAGEIVWRRPVVDTTDNLIQGNDARIEAPGRPLPDEAANSASTLPSRASPPDFHEARETARVSVAKARDQVEAAQARLAEAEADFASAETELHRTNVGHGYRSRDVDRGPVDFANAIADIAATRHVIWASDLGAVSRTIVSLGLRALQQSGGNWQKSQEIFERYLTGISGRFVKSGSQFGIEIQPAAIFGGQRVPAFVFLHRGGWNSPLITNREGKPQLFAFPGSGRLDAGFTI